MPEEQQPFRLPRAKFATGQLIIAPNALRLLGMEQIADALTRHAQGDWGEVSEADRQANEDALRDGNRLLSVYRADNGTKFYIITEGDRSLTTILLPEEY